MLNVLRSPIWSVLSIVSIALIMTIKLEMQQLPAWFYPLAYGAFIGSVLFFLIWIAAVYVHNRRQPAHKVRWIGLYPVEFREEDEGMRWLTYRACRTVYIFFYISLPVIMLLLFLFPDSRSFPIVLVALLAIVQYSIYWSVIRKVHTEEEES